MTGNAIREALEPFAATADDMQMLPADEVLLLRSEHISDFTLTVGDLRRARAAYDAIGSGLKALPDHVAQHYGDLGFRIVEFFDKDETAGSFLREDGDGGFVGGLYRMAREIDALRTGAGGGAGVKAPVDVYRVLKKWADAGSLDVDHISAISRDVASALSTHTAAGAGPVGEAVAWRVKDHADDWFLTDRAEQAAYYAEQGHAVIPLYARPAEEPGEMERDVWQTLDTAPALAFEDHETDPVAVLLCNSEEEPRIGYVQTRRDGTRRGMVGMAHGIVWTHWAPLPARAALTGDAQEAGR